MTALETLQRCALFRDFTETGMRIFSGIAAERAVSAGSPLFVEDMLGESLLIVKTGKVHLTQRQAGGGDREVGEVGPFEHLGALSLLAPSVRLVTAVAATPCEVVELARSDFARLQPQKPQACLKLAMAIAADLARRVGESREPLREMLARAAQGRA